MKLISLTIARNSSWCIAATLSHALKYCDGAVVLLHNTTDDTAKILRKLDPRITIASVTGEHWDEMLHRQQVLDIGRDMGGTHFLVLDDDEILTESLVPRMRDLAENHPVGSCVHLPLLSCWRSLDQYRSDLGNPFSTAYKTCLFADAPHIGWKATGGYHHHHTSPFGTLMVRRYSHTDGGFMHLQHANRDRLVTKQTWYMCMELVRWGKINADYRGTMNEAGLRVSPINPKWWGPERDLIKLNQEPWQLADMRRMITEKGADFFISRGVDVTPFMETANV